MPAGQILLGTCKLVQPQSMFTSVGLYDGESLQGYSPVPAASLMQRRVDFRERFWSASSNYQVLLWHQNGLTRQSTISRPGSKLLDAMGEASDCL